MTCLIPLAKRWMIHNVVQLTTWLISYVNQMQPILYILSIFFKLDAIEIFAFVYFVTSLFSHFYVGLKFRTSRPQAARSCAYPPDSPFSVKSFFATHPPPHCSSIRPLPGVSLITTLSPTHYYFLLVTCS